MEFLQDVSCFG